MKNKTETVIKIAEGRVFFKVISPDRQLWYGTFKTKKEAEDRMKNDYPKDEYKIIEVR